ncbi:MAG: PD40 domain-containing protein, partial [Planctomycetes bacterium]|nr:PD40 domain-containing protein [Planctomycetota bacterium]
MTEQNSQSGTRRQKRKRIVVSVVALVVLLAGAAAFLLLPRRVTDIVTVDGESRWSEDSAPTRRKIVWQTPEQVEGVTPREQDVPRGDPASRADEHSLIRPQLAEDGSALYFTLRKSDGEADIFRSKLVDGEWQAAMPVSELNTPADDIGPAISADGQRLYLYSDRAEGSGGFDLYVSKKTSDGWSKPRNLGPRINTSATEYAPA